MSAARENTRALHGALAGFQTDCEHCGQGILMVKTVERRVARFWDQPESGPEYLALDPVPHDQGHVALDVLGFCQPLRIGHPLHEGRLRQLHADTCTAAPPPAVSERRDLE